MQKVFILTSVVVIGVLLYTSKINERRDYIPHTAWEDTGASDYEKLANNYKMDYRGAKDLDTSVYTLRVKEDDEVQQVQILVKNGKIVDKQWLE